MLRILPHNKAGIFLCLVSVILLCWGVSSAQAPLEAGKDYETGVLLVKYKTGLSRETLEAQGRARGLANPTPKQLFALLRNQYQIKKSNSIPSLHVERWELPAGQTVDNALQTLKASNLVEYAEPNYRRYPAAPRGDGPDDYYYQNGTQWWLEAVEADRVFAENLTPQGSEIIIAVLDTGVLLTHQDLSGRLVAGKDYINANGNANDDDGHGTHVAGIAGAVANNAVGIAGTAGTANIKIMPVKVLANNNAGGYDSVIAQGVRWAVDQGARVINMSLSGPGMGKILEEAIDYAIAHDCVVVCAAGNEGETNLGNPVLYPAAYDPTVAVAACTRTGDRASYSEYHDYVDIAAPGGDGADIVDWIISLYYTADNAYAYFSGTSMATPIVSAVAALILAQDHTLSAAQVEQRLFNTADKTGSLAADSDGWNQYLGWGRVNAYKALTDTRTFKSKTTGRASYNFPNPFSPIKGEVTHILIPEAQAGQTARLKIYDALGYLVYEKEYPSTQVFAGNILGWDGHDKNGDWVANGVYPYRLTVGDKTYENKIAVINR